MAEKEIGKVIHFYDKAMVAVVRLTKKLKAGEMVKMSKGDKDFEFSADSMQLNHEPIKSGKAGDEIAIKVPEGIKEGAVVYKV